MAPDGLTLSINDGALYTTSATVTLSIKHHDEASAGYQMTGIEGVADPGSATWETYATSKSVTLVAGDGLKTVSIKVRGRCRK